MAKEVETAAFNIGLGYGRHACFFLLRCQSAGWVSQWPDKAPSKGWDAVRHGAALRVRKTSVFSGRDNFLEWVSRAGDPLRWHADLVRGEAGISARKRSMFSQRNWRANMRRS